MDETDAEKQGSARRGGEARGGITPQAGDPDTPQAIRKRDAAARKTMRDAGFGGTIGTEAD